MDMYLFCNRKNKGNSKNYVFKHRSSKIMFVILHAGSLSRDPTLAARLLRGTGWWRRGLGSPSAPGLWSSLFEEKQNLLFFPTGKCAQPRTPNNDEAPKATKISFTNPVRSQSSKKINWRNVERMSLLLQKLLMASGAS